MCYQSFAFNDRVSLWAVNNSNSLTLSNALSLTLQTHPNTGHSKKVNDFVQFKGALLTASSDGTLQVKLFFLWLELIYVKLNDEFWKGQVSSLSMPFLSKYA